MVKVLLLEYRTSFSQVRISNEIQSSDSNYLIAEIANSCFPLITLPTFRPSRARLHIRRTLSANVHLDRLQGRWKRTRPFRLISQMTASTDNYSSKPILALKLSVCSAHHTAFSPLSLSLSCKFLYPFTINFCYIGSPIKFDLFPLLLAILLLWKPF